MNFLKITAATIFSCLFLGIVTAHATSPILTPEENLWLQQRNNTIVVYPEQNHPPYSYQSPSGIIEGLSIDYIDLIAKKIGVNVQYLTPRDHEQILTDAMTGKGDVILSLAPTDQQMQSFVFTQPYLTVPFVIVVRKDVETKSALTLVDYGGKRIGMTEGSAAEFYVRTNFPRVIIEGTTDDEAALQQLVLGQVDAAVLDSASLSYLFSKQVLSSVKVVGMVGYDYQPAFAMVKDKEILQSILEKGFSQITDDEKKTFAEKWITLPQEAEKQTLFQFLQTGNGVLITYGVFALIVIALCFFLLRKRVPAWRRYQKNRVATELRDELAELESANKTLTEELREVKVLEEDIESKLKNLNE